MWGIANRPQLRPCRPWLVPVPWALASIASWPSRSLWSSTLWGPWQQAPWLGLQWVVWVPMVPQLVASDLLALVSQKLFRCAPLAPRRKPKRCRWGHLDLLHQEVRVQPLPVTTSLRVWGLQRPRVFKVANVAKISKILDPFNCQNFGWLVILGNCLKSFLRWQAAATGLFGGYGRQRTSAAHAARVSIGSDAGATDMLRMTTFERDSECSVTITVQFYFVVEQGHMA